jgi:hypothetical protein
VSGSGKQNNLPRKSDGRSGEKERHLSTQHIPEGR